MVSTRTMVAMCTSVSKLEHFWPRTLFLLVSTQTQIRDLCTVQSFVICHSIHTLDSLDTQCSDIQPTPTEVAAVASAFTVATCLLSLPVMAKSTAALSVSVSVPVSCHVLSVSSLLVCVVAQHNPRQSLLTT